MEETPLSHDVLSFLFVPGFGFVKDFCIYVHEEN